MPGKMITQNSDNHQLTLVPPTAVYPMDEQSSIEVRLDPDNKTVWMTQRQIAEMLGLTVQAISHQIQNFKADRGEAANRSIKYYLIVAEDGKQRDVEHYDQTVLIYVGFRAQATEKAIKFQDWIADIFGKHVHTQDKRRRDLQRLREMGYGETEATLHLAARTEGIEVLDQLKAMVSLIVDEPNFGQMFNTEYMSLFDKTAFQLKEILNTKDIRDKLPTGTLHLLSSAEGLLKDALLQHDRVSMDEFVALIRSVLIPLGQALAAVARFKGVDPVTGQPALPTVRKPWQPELADAPQRKPRPWRSN